MVRPRTDVSPALLELGGHLGVGSQILASPTAVSLVADLQLARTFSAQGNTSAANFFIQRAQNTDPNTAALLGGALGLPPGGTAPIPTTGGTVEAKVEEGTLKSEPRPARTLGTPQPTENPNAAASVLPSAA